MVGHCRFVLLAVEFFAGGLREGAEEVREEGADEADGQEATEEAWRSGSGRFLKVSQVWPKARALQIANVTMMRRVTKLPTFAIWMPWYAKRRTRQAAAAAAREPTAVPMRRAV